MGDDRKPGLTGKVIAMKLFNIRGNNVPQDAIARKIAGKILSSQRRVADKINDRFRNLPARNLIVVLVAFGTSFGTYCFYLIINAFF